MNQASDIIATFHSKKGNEIIFRYPRPSDAEKLTEYINTLSCERTYITLQGEQLTLEEEEKKIQEWRERIKEKTGVALFGFHNDRLIAVTNLQAGVKTSRHVGTFGISIADGYRDEGIGTMLLQELIRRGKEIGLRIIELKMFATNEKARHVYEKLGFVEVGRIPEGTLHRGEYIDEIIMVKKLT